LIDGETTQHLARNARFRQTPHPFLSLLSFLTFLSFPAFPAFLPFLPLPLG